MARLKKKGRGDLAVMAWKCRGTYHRMLVFVVLSCRRSSGRDLNVTTRYLFIYINMYISNLEN